MNSIEVPDAALAVGFVNQPVGTHSSRTIMVPEMRLLMVAAPEDCDYADYRRFVVEDNAVQKATVSGRREVFRRLAELYAFRPELPVFSAFRHLWRVNPEDDRLLALLLAAARDPLLRATAATVLQAVEADIVTTQKLDNVVEEAFPGRYRPGIRNSVARHTIASWAQSGHLVGRIRKVRAKAEAGPASVAYALFLGHLCGVRGLALFDTFWASLLDAPPSTLDCLAFGASQRGWIEYRRIGDVAEIGFDALANTVKGHA